MRSNIFKAILGKSGIAAAVLMLASGVSLAQTVVNLTAGPATATLPDGSAVPMWGYSCDTAADPACRPLNAAATTPAAWSPVVITVPTGNTLTIHLTNNLTFTGGKIPTSLTIVGQLGGGLGTPGGTTPSPNHATQTVTWPASSSDPGDGANTPPAQGARVRSFGTEVAVGTPQDLTWLALRPGTYLLESGSHPSIQGPMGLYGIVVVTSAPSGSAVGLAYGTAATPSAVNYGADIPLLLSEIDPVQNAAVSAAVNAASFSEEVVWSGQPGGCGNAGYVVSVATPACYPPAVNYAPLYFLVNGVAFDKSAPAATNPSRFATAPATGVSGGVLVRLVNAGLRMHIPSIVGSATTPAIVPTGVTATAAAGFSLVAEDGNPLPGVSRVQSEVFMAPGKTYDVMINTPAAGGTALPIFDRQGSLSGNATARDAGMLAYISVNGAALPGSASLAAAVARADTYGCAAPGPCALPGVVAGRALVVSDPAKGVIANDTNVNGVQLIGTVSGLTLNANGTFTYTGAGATAFDYCANGSGATVATCSSGITAHVTLGTAPIEALSGITCTIPAPAYTSTVATTLTVKPPGVLSFCKDAAGYPLHVTAASLAGGGTVAVDPDGGFTVTGAAAGSRTLTFTPTNSQGTAGTPAVATLAFPAGSGLAVSVVDGTDKTTAITDYRWIIEEDRTFYVDPNCQTNPLPGGCPAVNAAGAPAVFGTNFHTSYMPVIAQGCVGAAGTAVSCEAGQSVLDTNPSSSTYGQHVPAACDIGNGACRAAAAKTPLDPSMVVLDPTKHYYISILPGDAMDPGHGMGGAQIPPAPACTPTPPATTCTPTFAPVTVLLEPENQKAANLSVFVFEDDHPLNGEHDGGGGAGDTLSPNEPGLGGFNITILDLVGGTGDSAGQLTYDEFGQPLSNALAGTMDPLTSKDACPIVADPFTGSDGATRPTAITGVIPVCPNYESDGVTLSPLGGQAVVAGLPPGRYGIVATPAADRIARGEEWLQTNTLDGGKDLEAFLKNNEPTYFQEFGPAGFHVSMGFANPVFINAWSTTQMPQEQGGTAALCPSDANPCTNSVIGHVTGVHMSRPSDERLYGTGTRDTFGYTQCYASLGSSDGADFSFAKCNPDDGSFVLTGIPAGDWRVTIFDQWNDQIVDGITTPVRVASGGSTLDMGEVAVHAWKNNLSTRTCIDSNRDGVCQADEPGLPLVPTNIRFRDGSVSNLNSTDLDGYAGFNEVFPLFNWYVMKTDANRYKNTGTHVINDAGGPVDGSTGPAKCNSTANDNPGYPACGNSGLLANMARTNEDFPLPTALRVPGAVYCGSLDADCASSNLLNFPTGGGPGGSTGRIDPAWVTSYGWQSFAGQNQYLEFGKRPFAAGENGGIRGHVVYASTRPFDDPALLLQLTWEPMVPHVTINLYQVGTAPDGSQSLTKVDSTQTSSWDDWAQGFRSDGVPNMNCPGQSATDPFFYAMQNQPNYLDWYNAQHGGPAATALPNSAQYKCYDGMHNWNQLQPAPYDGMYQFPSIVRRDPVTGRPVGLTATSPATNCTICGTDTDGDPMLPAGKYVVEMVVPTGYELVKEEDKNILLGDTYEAPVTSQFAGFGAVFIMPDQAAVAATYNPNNSLNMTTDLGAQPRHEGDTGSVETFWPCVGAARVVPDFNSLFPQAGQNAPFAGATRPLCDRKLVTLEDQMSVLAKFYVFSSTHVAGHFTGTITDDFTSEFDPFSPHFGEKFSPPNLPVSVKDWAGNEVGRVYSDMHGIYNGLNYSSFSVNPPDPSGYIPMMMVMCMNDRGSGATAADPLYQESYSQFCYELPFMPGQTGYFDTPVIPTAAFAAEYNHPDCAYPDATPEIGEVDGNGVGPYVSASGNTLTIYTVNGKGTPPAGVIAGDQAVNNYGYSGPNGLAPAPYNSKKITRHYGFGASQGTGSVTIGGVAASVGSWNDTTITVTVPANVPFCSVQQQAQYGGSTARCGELVITAGNGKKSVDTVTVTIGGKAPTRVDPTGVSGPATIQAAIDSARPGDLIIVPPGTYHEILVMWKPVRLQGVGAASSILDANAHPAGILTDWRLRIVCLFGLAPNGVSAGYDPACGTGWSDFSPSASNPQIDRLPLEATVGWDATLNGNLAEQLQEPTLMGAYEGAGITVLAKGVRFPAGSNPFAADTFPVGTTLLYGTPFANPLNNNTGDANVRCHTNNNNAVNPFPSNFQCNPSRIDGLAVTNSSQGGGGIFVHAWAHNLEISNNRVYNNQGTLAGGIAVGQGEHPDGYLVGTANPDPGSCRSDGGLPTNTQLPFCFNLKVNVHHNAVTNNSSEGDELFSATPSGAGGVAFCTGDDYYKFNYNWVCGNLTTGDGAGVSQLGYIYHDGNDSNRGIQHNTILFNEAVNPTTPSNGGGLLVMAAPDTDPACAGEPDVDCNHAFGTVGDGIGPNLLINANLIMGNAAEAGSGGGIRFQSVNGSEVGTFPNNNSRWYSVRVTNNIITNNVAGWDGAGVSLQDSLVVNLVNNTIVSNDSTASSGSLFGAFFSSQASAPTPCPRDGNGVNIPCVPISAPQPAGVSSAGHTAEFLASLPASISCPTGHGTGGACRSVSFPILYNDVLWQNRAFNIVVTNPAAGAQQATVALVPALNQGTTGQCVSTGATYWDIGLRGDISAATDHSSGFTFAPQYSVLSSTAGYSGLHNMQADPLLVSQYCNGSKIPPELGAGAWYQVPPGTNESNVPIPVFNLTAGATVDEGNNWINISWGPLSLVHPSQEGSPSTETLLGDATLQSGSPAINQVPSTAGAPYTQAPSDDYFGSARKTASAGAVDIGAVEFGGTVAQPTLASIAPTSGRRGTAVPVTLIGTNLTNGTVNVSGGGISVGPVSVTPDGTTLTTTFTIAGNATAPRTVRNVSVTTPGGTTGNVTFTVSLPTLAAIAPASGLRGTAVPVTLTGTLLTGGTVNVTGAGVTASGTTVSADGTTLNTTLSITTGAAATARTVSVTTPNGGGTSNSLTFTVGRATLTSVSPNSGARGTSVPVTLSGTNLAGATGVTVSGSGVSVTNVTIVDANTVTATFTMTAGAGLGARNVTVNTTNGPSTTVAFTVVNPPPPTLASIAPVSGTHGTSVPVTLTGTNFTATGSSIALSPAGPNVTVSGVTVLNSTTITATINMSAAAMLGSRNVTVTTPGGTTGVATFTVN